MKGLAIGLAAVVASGAAAALPSTSSSTPEASQGAILYKQTCATCHMADGSGVPNLQPALDGGNRVVVGKPATLIALMLEGPAVALPADREKYANQMPSFEALTDEEIAAVLTYVRTSFGNKATPITAKQVTAARAKR
jgi:mono/diheme cytochrome c family protein